MRPLEIQLEGVTSFRARQRVVFSDNLFVISGIIGAGKSSLLDAISYALYGEPARPGVTVKDLISLGLPSMRVSLEFSVAGARYRVTRNALRKVSGDALLEEITSGRSLASGSTAVTAEVVRIVGFGHDVFVRSVMLPQGEFARFLKGTPKEKQQVLADLIGLDFYARMAECAGGKAQLSLGRVQAAEQLAAAITATESDVEEAERSAAASEEAARLGDALAAEVMTLVADWQNAAAEAGAAKSRAEVADSLRTKLSAQVDDLRSVWDAYGLLNTAVSEANLRVEDTERRVKEARAAIDELVAQYGDARSLDGELAVLKRADEAASDLEERTRRLHELQSEFPRLSDAEIDARRLLGEAEAAEQEATRTYQAATMTRGLSVGDPCPICGAALEQLPKAHGRAEVDKAKSVVTRRKQDVETAVGAALECKTAIGVAEKEMEKARTHRESLVSGVNERYPGLKQDDIMALVNERLEQIAILEIALKRASSENEEALATARQAEAMYRGAEQQLAQLREGLASSVGLATDLVDTSDHPPSVLPDNSAVVAWAAFWSECLGSEEVRLRKLAEGREARAADLAEQALGKLDGWVDGPVAMERIEVQLSQRIAELKAKGAACRAEAARLRDEIARRDKLVAGTGPERERGQTYESLRKELLPANFPKFVVAQALDLLCEHASERLWTMTERYRLVSRGAEFFVVDTWAADEERSVKTLSGGETFLASLSLALALSEHVLTLAADQRVRLECLFIDEGFGSLDRESLDAAINALEILQSQSDRMVALVTHVTELADRLPHIEVVKYQDGSQIEVQQAIAPLPPPVEKPRPRVPRKKEPAVAQPSLL